MSITTQGNIRLSQNNKERMKTFMPKKSFNDIVEAMLDQVEQQLTVSDDTRKALCKKFDLDENTLLETILENYLIHGRQERVNSIRAVGNAAVLIEQYGDTEDVLSAIETTYLPIIDNITNDGGTVNLGSLTKALRVTALIIIGQRLSGLKND